MKCRHCKTNLQHTVIDLASSPPSNSYLSKEKIDGPETWYPLKVLVCENCWLVQTEDFVQTEEMFSEDYAYFSSYSSSWVKHAEEYVNAMESRFSLESTSNVVEVASNDGYLLQFVKNKGINCYGIEPTHSTANAAREKGIDVIESFFGKELGRKLADKGESADLMAANNVLAHVPDINDFVQGFTELLKPSGVVTFEFPHLLNLLQLNQFDTIYHEHYSYLSLIAVVNVLKSNGLNAFDVEEISTHGGSLRIFAQRQDTGKHSTNESVDKMLQRERQFDLEKVSTYQKLQKGAVKIKANLLSLLIKLQSENKTIVGYGAAAKGNTLLNYSGVKPDLLPFVIDKNLTKQGQYMPGSRIPIVDESVIKDTKPEYILILPWNLKSEIVEQLSYTREWGAKFVTLVPDLQIS
jgi:2-polyprenyl-3-methyl-5-hydroxy-6-metoxy-1,4-benzoquinol methylase